MNTKKTAPRYVRDARFEAHVGAELYKMIGGRGITIAGRMLRADAGETAAFARQLEFIRAQTYDLEHTPRRARELIPADNSVPEWADEYTDRGYDEFGMARFSADYADDPPRADVVGFENTRKVWPLQASYAYSIAELQKSRVLSIPLDIRKSQAARNAIENSIEQLACNGTMPNAASTVPPGFVGFASSGDVNVIDKTDLVGDWSDSTSAADLLDDLRIIGDKVKSQSKETHDATDIVMPTAELLLFQKPYSTLNGETIQSVYERAHPTRKLRSWSKLATCGSTGGTRVVAYERSPLVLAMVEPLPFTQLPPQARNYSFFVPCHSRWGGVAIPRPIGMVYADITVT